MIKVMTLVLFTVAAYGFVRYGSAGEAIAASLFVAGYAMETAGMFATKK